MNVPKDNIVSSRDHPGAARDAIDADLEGALAQEPDRNFAAVRLAFVTLLFAAIVLPLIYVIAASINDLSTRKREAAYTTSRVARIAEEHAIKVFDLNQGLDERVIDLLGDLSDSEIRLREKRIHDRLQKLGGGYPQVASVSIFGKDGGLLANSVAYPVAASDFKKRGEFPTSRDADTLDVSPLMRDAATGQAVFNTSIARLDEQGHFAGVVAVALKADYFYDFYKDLVGSERSITVGLIRENGNSLVHYPPEPVSGTASASATGASASDVRPSASDAMRSDTPSLHAISHFLNGLVVNSKDGAGSATLRANGTESIIAYRRAAGYPVYVFASYPSQAVVTGWLSHVGLLAGGVLVPCLVLWAVILTSLRRLGEEERAWLAWREEAATRRSVEAAFRQARRTQALGNLVGSVAHDFNNLLMTMSANTQVVRRRGPANVANEVAAIERAIKSGKLLTRQLLGVARKQPQRTETIKLQDWLPRAEPLLAASVSAEVALVLHIDPLAWPIEADAAELELALMNVAVNARDAMTEGGTLSIRVENLHLADGAAFAHAGDYVRISLTDTGTGMPAAVLNRAFEPLFTTKPQGMGTGLGLPQVSGFCEQAGGTATIESTSGRGTTVRFYLPRAKELPNDVAPPLEAGLQARAASVAAGQVTTTEARGGHGIMRPAPLSAAAGGADAVNASRSVDGVPDDADAGHSSTGQAANASNAANAANALSDVGSGAVSTTLAAGGDAQANGAESEEQVSILLVEDNPDVAAGTEALLSVMGHRTQWVDNADTALELLLAIRDSQALGFDMVLSDIHMPGTMTGIDLAIELRSSLPDLSVVLVTGYASEIERAKQARIPVLAKPFDVEVLETLIRRAAHEHVVSDA